MRARRYAFASTWQVAAPVEDTWAFLTAPSQRWHDWWPHLDSIDVRRTPELVGSTAACRWRSPVGYALAFTLELTAAAPGELVELDVEGDLIGHSVVRFAAAPGGTRIDIDLTVRTTRPWMNMAGTVLRPLFQYGHDVVMHHGERGLNRVLAPVPSPPPG